MGLDSKNKLDFLDGKIKEPTLAKGEKETVEHVAWRQCSAMVKMWLRNVIHPKLHAGIAFSGTVTEIWDELKERYTTRNEPRVHQLKSELNELKQGKLTIVEYYTKLKGVWDELASYSRVPRCTCGAGKAILREKEEEKVHQFLIGLDDAVYGGLRTNILMEEPIPALSRVYGVILREERHKAIVRSKEDKTEKQHSRCKRAGLVPVVGKQGILVPVVDKQGILVRWTTKRDATLTVTNGAMMKMIVGRRTVYQHTSLLEAEEEGAGTSANQGTNQGSVPGVEVSRTREELQSLRALLQPTKENSKKMAGPIFEEDDWSGRGVWVYLMTDRGEVGKLLISFYNMIQRQFNKPVKIIQSDNGTEFQSLSMRAYYRDQGIVLRTSNVDTPQQNGRVERKHRHILEKVYPMQVGVPSQYKKQVTVLVDTTGLEQADYSQFNSEGDDVDELLSEEEPTDDEEVVTGAGEGGEREAAASNTPSAVEELWRGASEKFEPAWRKDYIFTSTTVINTIEDNPCQSKSSRKEYKEPRHYGEASNDPLWREAMRQEIKALESNNSWQVVNLPIGKKPIGCKWIYKIKYKADGSVERYKARLVVQGFTQVEGIDFH
ncbi:uncharacterized protein LOC141601004 [Silene latifolia]|uniref:uncharacterized protein LOC141601004 n=1 Tax=Silene latifolia TaxID=37657 RepID=UPI003D775DF8